MLRVKAGVHFGEVADYFIPIGRMNTGTKNPYGEAWWRAHGASFKFGRHVHIASYSDLEV